MFTQTIILPEPKADAKNSGLADAKNLAFIESTFAVLVLEFDGIVKKLNEKNRKFLFVVARTLEYYDQRS